MAQKTRAQLNTANAALFTANGAKAITGPLEKEYNEDVNDSFAIENDLAIRLFNGVPGAAQNVAAGYIVGQSRLIDYNTQIEYLYESDSVTAVWAALSGNFTPTLTPDTSVCTAASSVGSSYTKNGGIVNVMHVIEVDLDFTSVSTGTIALSDLPFTATGMAGGGFIQDPSTTPVTVFYRNNEITFLNNSGTETFTGLRVNIIGQSTI